jgi:hypothetical protein
MKIVFGEVNTTSVLGDKRVRMAQFSARLIELQAGAARQPYSRYSLVIQGGRELIEAGNALSVLRKKGVDRYVENAGGLAQTILRR